MNQLKIFIELSRLNKPIGFMLLFWPCSWGLAYAYYFNQNLNLFVYYLILFFLGSLLMRSAGCIFNDIVDKDFDNKVQRTKKRPIASGKITVKQSLFYVFILCFLAFLILIQFNNLTIMLGMGSMILAFAYPFMKRITYWPQLFLGLTFNWGLIMAWTSITNELNVEIVILYISAIFWTLGYDTIYGVQDMSDDEIIGLKSTSIKFKKNIKTFVTTSYLITLFTLIFVFKDFLGVNIFSFLILMFFLSLLFQIMKFKKSNSKSCLEAFKFNNVSGFILFLAIVIINFKYEI
jgi:4-hydroxybenzoate polyprenyltransferase|tara:strand:- start:272 stop:1144 length:873 start_codon:yes stop_codon:yes gene_type:complete